MITVKMVYLDIPLALIRCLGASQTNATHVLEDQVSNYS